MGRVFLASLTISVVLASVVFVSSALAALPEFETSSFPVTFTSTSVLPLEPELNGMVLGILVKVVCKMDTSDGEIPSPTTQRNIKAKYTECRSNGSACTTSGQAVGTIVSGSLAGTLGYISKVTKTVGIELKPEAGTEFAKFTCSGLPGAVVTGCLIGELTPVNKMATSYLALFEAVGETQVPSKLEGGAQCNLGVFGSAAALMDKDSLGFSGLVQIKA